MAILINKSIDNIMGSLTVNNLYIRLNVNMGFSGTSIDIWIQIYLDKTAYINNKASNIAVADIPNKFKFSYNRLTDDKDILLFAHNSIMNYLSTDKKEMIPQTDSVTGEILYNEITGEPILIDTITTPKFCNLSDLSIIDM